MSGQRPVVVGIALVVALTVAGCASGGKARVSGASMCQAHGGTYNTATKSCSYTATTRSAKQICESHPGGYWDDAAGFCNLGAD